MLAYFFKLSSILLNGLIFELKLKYLFSKGVKWSSPFLVRVVIWVDDFFGARRSKALSPSTWEVGFSEKDKKFCPSWSFYDSYGSSTTLVLPHIPFEWRLLTCRHFICIMMVEQYSSTPSTGAMRISALSRSSSMFSILESSFLSFSSRFGQETRFIKIKTHAAYPIVECVWTPPKTFCEFYKTLNINPKLKMVSAVTTQKATSYRY